MLLKTLIVDDEPVARRVLREELESMDTVEVVGEADSGTAALEQIAALQPDLVLLDLQMPGMNGLEVVRQLRGGPRMPAIVIVTAYDQYAIQAFEAEATDYLLKPVARERLAEAIERAKRVTARGAAERVARLQELGKSAGKERIRKIVGRSGEEYIVLNAAEVYAFQADGDLVWIMTAKNKYLAGHTLRYLEDRLSGSSFRRVHRNALVNIDQVRKMSALSSQRWLITLGNGLEFIVSKRQAKGIRHFLNW